MLCVIDIPVCLCAWQTSQAACSADASLSRIGGTLERAGSIQSLSQAPFNTSLSFGSSHGPSAVSSISFTSETVPLAVAFCETVHAYFSGSGSDVRLEAARYLLTSLLASLLCNTRQRKCRVADQLTPTLSTGGRQGMLFDPTSSVQKSSFAVQFVNSASMKNSKKYS